MVDRLDSRPSASAAHAVHEGPGPGRFQQLADLDLGAAAREKPAAGATGEGGGTSGAILPSTTLTTRLALATHLPAPILTSLTSTAVSFPLLSGHLT